jgi:hypothetical protein
LEIKILKAPGPLRRRGDKTRYYSRLAYRLTSAAYALTLVIFAVYLLVK